MGTVQRAQTCHESVDGCVFLQTPERLPPHRFRRVQVPSHSPNTCTDQFSHRASVLTRDDEVDSAGFFGRTCGGRVGRDPRGTFSPTIPLLLSSRKETPPSPTSSVPDLHFSHFVRRLRFDALLTGKGPDRYTTPPLPA